MALIVAGVTAGSQVAVAHAETRRLRACADLARAVAALPFGTQITGCGGNWGISVPAMPVASVAAAAVNDGGQDD
ncbi:hypothetical protein PVK74_30525 [Micromonospora chalcea]|uniref:hypothetical protein n=1 Tax=Micromonospora chalcea TaxID=1874 RepID=UPI002378898C|nr:hypothetical protein [Micromonospora chalcea]WDQ00107.1 hypothetical protein PVK74_30525 [Micromonospora chalcea]